MVFVITLGDILGLLTGIAIRQQQAAYRNRRDA